MFDYMIKLEPSGKFRVRDVEKNQIKYMTKQELIELIKSLDPLDPIDKFAETIDSGQF